MRPGRPSRTAEAAAAVRAAEATRPPADRLLDDHLARRFVTSPLWRGLLAVPAVAVRALEWYDRRMPGVVSWILLRAAFAEHVLRRAAGDGLEQVVLVGAGYDTTAVRVALPDRVRVFELDHPDTQRVKRRVLDGLGGTGPVVVGCDLGRDDLAAVLDAAGHDPARRSLFVFLAVSMFLDASAVVAAVGAMARLLPPGGLLLHDYVSWPVGGSADAAAAESWAAARGEPWRSTWNAAAMEELLGTAGLSVREAYTTRELARRHGAGRPSARRAADWVSVVLSVKGATGKGQLG